VASPAPTVGQTTWRTRSDSAIPLTWASAVVALGVIPSFLTGALVVQMRSDFELTPATLGLLVGLFYGSAALASGPAGRVVQRVGSWTGMQAATIGAAICMGGIALLVHDAPTLGFFLVLGGLANSASNPAANLLLVDVMPASRRALALGVKQSAIPIATLLAGLSIPLLALPLGWRWAFGVIACAAAVIAAVAWLNGRPPRRASHEADPASMASVRPKSARRRAELLILATGAMLGIWGGQALGTYLVSYTVGLGQSPASAGLVLTVASLAGISARIVAGWIVDRRGTTGVGELQAMLAIGAVGLLLIAIGLPGLIWLGPVLAFAGGWGWSGVLTYVAVRLDPAAPAAATGVTQTGVFLGATISVPLFGVIVEASSYRVAWFATIVTMLFALGLVHVVGRRWPAAGGD
jgi:predicted MFS family arabinose efflux permease